MHRGKVRVWQSLIRTPLRRNLYTHRLSAHVMRHALAEALRPGPIQKGQFRCKDEGVGRPRSPRANPKRTVSLQGRRWFRAPTEVINSLDEHEAQTSQASGLQRQRANFNNHSQQCQLPPRWGPRPLSVQQVGARRPPETLQTLRPRKQNNPVAPPAKPQGFDELQLFGLSFGPARRSFWAHPTAKGPTVGDTSKVVGQSVGPQ